MVKITKRVVEAADAREKDYLIWDDELPGFGLRIFSSGKRSYVIQYRTRGRSRRYTIGLHGAWAPETARREARVQLGRVAGGDDPVEDRQLDHKAITVKELCTRYLADLKAGLILGKGGRPNGIRKPKDNVRKRRLSEAEYRILGGMLRAAAKQEKYATIVDIIRQLALTGCRRSEMIGLKWTEADAETSCLRLEDSKEGESIRPIGLPVVEYLDRRRTDDVGTYVFPGQGEDNAFGSFPNHWKHIFKDSPLSDVTPHVLRHSFASIANDLGFTEVTIAALVGHAKGSVTSKYIHTLDTALIMAADTISGYIQGLLDGIEFKQTAYALDRDSRKAALARFLKRASGSDQEVVEEERRLAA